MSSVTILAPAEVSSNNHSFFFQDSWVYCQGLTSTGDSDEKENLPAENQPSGAISNPINFVGDKIAPE